MPRLSGPARRTGRATTTRAHSQFGFSLLEVLVAFAILAVSLGVLMGIFARAMQVSIAATQYSQAATLAESLLNSVGSAVDLEDGSLSGETDLGFSWELTMTQVELLTEEFTEPPATPYRVNATVLWNEAGRARNLTLSTLRLGKPLDASE